MNPVNICYCGGEAGYPASHSPDCPGPLYGAPSQTREARWYRERDERRRELAEADAVDYRDPVEILAGPEPMPEPWGD